MLKQEEQKTSKCRKSGNIIFCQKRRTEQENRGDQKRTEHKAYTWRELARNKR